MLRDKLAIIHIVFKISVMMTFFAITCCGYSFAQNVHYADSLIEVYHHKELHDTTRLNILTDIAFDHPVPSIKQHYAQELIELAKKQDNPLFVYKGFILLGYAYKAKGDVKNAAENFYKGLETAIKIDHKNGVGGAYTALGQLYIINKDPKSIDFYKKAENIFLKLNDSVRYATTLLNIGDAYISFNKIDSAYLYTDRAEEIFNKLNHQTGLAYSIGNKGLIYAKQEKYRQAEQNIKKASVILKELGDYYPICVHQISMADIFMHKGEFDKALDYAYASLVTAKEVGLKEQIRDASLKLAEIYAAKGNYADAYNFQQQYLIYRDSINNEENVQRIAEIRREFELAQKQDEIDHLQRDKQQQQTMLLGLFLIILLSCIIIYILYIYNKQKKALNIVLTKRNEELAAQRNQLEALNDTRSRFFSIISHDLRGPVNAFNGISKLIKHYISTNQLKQLAEISNFIDTSANQLSHLLDNLLNWSVSQRGEFPYKPERVQLKPMMLEIISTFQTMAHAKNIKLEAVADDNIAVWADNNSLLTILRNLTSNALKFTNDGGSVTLTATTYDTYAELKVADTGIGISQEQLDPLFNFRDEKRTWGTAGEKGLGIGLQLVHEFAKMNDCPIEVHSKEGTGTTFIVKIPLYNAVKHTKTKRKLASKY